MYYKCNTSSTYLWVVVIDKVEVDPQLPHALKRISEPQTKNKNPKKTKVTPHQSLHTFPTSPKLPV